MQISHLFKKDQLLMILGLCPLLYVTTSLSSAAVVACVFFFVLMLSVLFFQLLKPFINQVMQLAMSLLIIAMVVTVFDLIMSVYFYEWRLAIGIYLPLMVMNFVVLSKIQEDYFETGLKEAIKSCAMTGIGIAIILLAVGLIRSLLSGALFAADGLILFTLVPGAFISLGLILAAVQFLENSKTKPQ